MSCIRLMTRAGRGGIEEYDPNTNIVTLGGAGGLPKGSRHYGEPQDVQSQSWACLSIERYDRAPYGLRHNPRSNASVPATARILSFDSGGYVHPGEYLRALWHDGAGNSARRRSRRKHRQSSTASHSDMRFITDGHLRTGLHSILEFHPRKAVALEAGDFGRLRGYSNRRLHSPTGTATLQPPVPGKRDSHSSKNLGVPRRRSFGTDSSARITIPCRCPQPASGTAASPWRVPIHGLTRSTTRMTTAGRDLLWNYAPDSGPESRHSWLRPPP